MPERWLAWDAVVAAANAFAKEDDFSALVDALVTGTQEGVLVPEGMVAVNPDDLATLLAAVGELGHISVAELDAAEALRAVLAASNPTTETPDA